MRRKPVPTILKQGASTTIMYANGSVTIVNGRIASRTGFKPPFIIEDGRNYDPVEVQLDLELDERLARDE